MKHLSVIISVLFSILCIGCSKEDFDTGKTNDIQNEHSLRLLVYTPNSETVLNTDLLGSIEAYLFKEGVLSDVYKNLTVDKNGYTTISSLAEEGQIYFFVNTGKLLNGITEEIGRLKETELLATTISSSSPQADGEKPVMTGKADLTGSQESSTQVLLTRAIARIDLKIADDADIQINRISMDNIHCEAFLFPQNPVSSPSGAALAKIDTTFDTPLSPGEHTGLVYLYEQVGDGIPVELHGTLEGDPVTLSLALPDTIHRNCIYKIKLFCGDNANLQASISVENESWETEETITAKPSSSILVNSELSTLSEGAYLSATKDTVYLPSKESTSILVLDKVPEDAEFTIDGTTASITPYTETRADLQGKKFLVRTSWKKPGTETEYVYLNMHSKKQPEHYSGRLVIVQATTTTFKGELYNHLTNTPPYNIHFNKYIDSVLGQMEVPKNCEVIVSGGSWLRAIPQGEGVYEIQAGYKPNDPEANGSTQECVLTVNGPNGIHETYTVTRLNHGLPVVLMGDTYWCRFNLQGNSRSFDDQITVSESETIGDLSAYFASCSDEEFVRLTGSQYKGRYTQGMNLKYDASVPRFYFDSYGALQNPAIIGNGPANSHCPDGYQLPASKDFEHLLKSGAVNYTLNGAPVNYTTGSGRPAVISAHSRGDVAWEGGLLATATYIQIAFDENNLVLGALGHQFDSSKSIASKVLWATISGGNKSWTHTGATAKAEDHNANKSRTVRCIKTPPAFIIEE